MNSYDSRYANAPRVNLPDRQPVIRVVPFPSDVNPAGDVFGGWVMAHVDEAGAICAVARARGRVATIAVNAFQFKQPIVVGDVLSFYAEVLKVGTTSVTVGVEVYATHHPYPADPFSVKVTEAVLTFVALDTDGCKRKIPT